MLDPLPRIAPIFYTPYYLINLAINAIVCAGINGIIDYFMNRHKDPIIVVTGGSIVEVMIFTAVVSLIYFFLSGEIHKRIKADKCRPVARAALCDSLLKRIVFFSINEPNWKMRFWKYMINAQIVGMLPATILLWMFCWMSRDFKSGDCTGPIGALVGWNMVWKGCVVMVVYSLNYPAAHCDEQPEVAPETGSPASQLMGEQEQQVTYKAAAI